MKINSRVQQLRRRFPKRQTGTGFLYRGAIPPANKKFSFIKVHAIFVNNEGLVFLRDHVFGSKKKSKTRREWKAWLDAKYGTVLADGILPGLAEKHGGLWRLHTLVGWSAHVNIRP